MASSEVLQSRVERVRALEDNVHTARALAKEGYSKLVAEVADEIVSDTAVDRLISASPDEGMVASVKDAISDKISRAYWRSRGDVVDSIEAAA